MDRNEIILKILNFLGWILYFIKMPFKFFGKLGWKAKIVAIIFLLLLFDNLRFWLFDFLYWLLS